MSRSRKIALYSALSANGGGGGATPVIVGTIKPGGSFPTTRPNGDALVLGDYVKVDATVTQDDLPFTISGITINSLKDTCSWLGGGWLLNANAYQKTNEMPLLNKLLESPSGESNYQNQVNIEIVEKLKTLSYEHTQSIASNTWTIEHNMGYRPNVIVIDSSGAECVGDISYTDENNIVITFNGAMSGKAYLS